MIKPNQKGGVIMEDNQPMGGEETPTEETPTDETPAE